MFITNKIKYIGSNDENIDLFESQYTVPNGVTYNSYLILDDKTVLMDTVDKRRTNEWLINLKSELDGRNLNYVVILHMEPDHAGGLKLLLERYPEVTVIGNQKTFTMISNFFETDELANKIVVNEGDEINFGEYSLKFYMAPMVHWPEAMTAYLKEEKILFSADAFGKFGTIGCEDWLDEARRYYINIVGKYGAQVQKLLKNLNGLEILKILPLHGDILDNNLAYYIEKYLIWSSYNPEESGVTIAYASIHGNTEEVAFYAFNLLKSKGISCEIYDLSRNDSSFAVASAFKFDKLLLLASSYDASVFPPMEDFLIHLKAKFYQKRKVAIIENGSWAPTAGRVMKAYVDAFKETTICQNVVSIRSSMKEKDKPLIDDLLNELLTK